MSGIDWTTDRAQRIDVTDLADDVFYERVMRAVADLSDDITFTRRQRLGFWLGDTAWRLRRRLTHPR